MKEITVEAIIENVAKVTEFVDVQLEAVNCPMKELFQINIAIDELFSNICYYAYNEQEKNGKATIKVEVDENDRFITISFIDQGIKYNPLEKKDPDITASAEEREIGGLGIYMVKKTMNEISYEYKDGKNILMIKKDI